MKNLIITVILAVGIVAGGSWAMQGAMNAMSQPKHNCDHCKVKKSSCCPTKKKAASNPSAPPAKPAATQPAG